MTVVHRVGPRMHSNMWKSKISKLCEYFHKMLISRQYCDISNTFSKLITSQERHDKIGHG